MHSPAGSEGCLLAPTASPSCHPPAILLASSGTACSQHLPSLPTECPYKGTGTAPGTVLPRLRSSPAPGPATLLPGTTATLLCHGHCATATQPCRSAATRHGHAARSWQAAEPAEDGMRLLPAQPDPGAGTRHLCRDGSRLSGQAVGVTATHSPPNMPGQGCRAVVWHGKSREEGASLLRCTEARGGCRRVPAQGDSVSQPDSPCAPPRSPSHCKHGKQGPSIWHEQGRPVQDREEVRRRAGGPAGGVDRGAVRLRSRPS